MDRERTHVVSKLGADHGPIEARHREQMNTLAAVLDEMFNGPNCPAEKKAVGFFLTTFNFDAPGRFNYISNANKLDVRAMLYDIIGRIEGRMAAAPETPQ